MKLILSLFLLSSLMTKAQAQEVNGEIKIGNGEDLIRIEIGNGDRHQSNRELRLRIGALERAVQQLQREVFQLQREPKPAREQWKCIIQTPFKKVYEGLGISEAAARLDVQMKCKKREFAMHCEDEDTNCAQIE